MATIFCRLHPVFVLRLFSYRKRKTMMSTPQCSRLRNGRRASRLNAQLLAKEAMSVYHMIHSPLLYFPSTGSENA